MSLEATTAMPHRGEANARESRIRRAIARAGHLLPDQGPIGTFVHHNTLHAFQRLPFDDALEAAARIHGAQVRLPESAYRAHWSSGRITDEDVAEALARAAGTDPDDPSDPLGTQAIRTIMLRHGLGEETDGSVRWRLRAGEIDTASPRWSRCAARAEMTHPRAAPAPPASLRELALARGAPDPAAHANGVMIRFLSAYLDEGMARWPMPDRGRGLVACMASYQATTRAWLHPAALRPPWLDDVGERIRMVRARGPIAAVGAMLDEVGVAPEDWDDFIARTLLQLPGWHGMVARLERHPEDRAPDAPPVSLEDLTALRLCLDLASTREALREIEDPATLRALWASRPRELPRASTLLATWRLHRLCEHAGLSAEDLDAIPTEHTARWLAQMDAFDDGARRRVLHDAYELHHQHEVLGALADLRAHPLPTASSPRFQVAFCIDDREEGIRRHFEELDPAHETFGVAGFFGVAMRYESLDDPRPAALCPVVVTPRHRIVERPRDAQDPAAALRRRRQRLLGLARREVADASRAFALGALFTSLAGALAVIPLTLRIIAPRMTARLQTALLRRWLPTLDTELALARGEEAPPATAGFTLDERADRVATTLQNIGLRRGFAPLVTVLGHGASTVNNPHHSAYDCGACGGRNGGPNARAFAAMANDPAVRVRLRDKGIDVPDGTWFLGGVHDTTTDAVTLWDLDRVPAALRGELDALRARLDEARARSAHERCRRFAHAPLSLTPAEALAHVEARAVDLAQARPELGHVTNAVTVVGRRALTRGLFLDRRALLVSYDPSGDDDGAVLSRVLGAVVPVCAGINLEYYFSTVDNERWGSGTKLPHNLAALLGVMEGTRGDLRTGLPRQMIEIHEPLRLLLLVEATPARLEATLAADPLVAEFVEKEWVRLVSIDPDDGTARVWARGGFSPWTRVPSPLATVRSAMDWYAGHRDHLPPARVTPDTEVL